jgi:sugar phosphate isomerase/epimerase
MDIGIFTKTFIQSSLQECLDAVLDHGLTKVQFNMSNAGIPSLPDFINPEIEEKIIHETRLRNIQIVAVSGTFNMIHPNVAERKLGLSRLRTLAASCKGIGTSVITLCTGTRHPTSMWKKHPQNSDQSAWDDLLETMEQAIRIAEDYQIILAFEPEMSNVIDNAKKGRILLDTMKSENLKVVMDPANLFEMETVNKMQETLDEAFHLLGDDIIISHAKDIIVNGELEFVAAGEGILDYDAYLQLLRSTNFKGPLILHGLEVQQVDKSVHFLRKKLISF